MRYFIAITALLLCATAHGQQSTMGVVRSVAVTGTYADTNHIYVSGATTPAGANDVYTLKTPGTTVWTNSAGTFGIWHDPTGNTPSLLGYWELSNTVPTSQFEATAENTGLGAQPGSTWTATGGTGSPTVTYGTNTSIVSVTTAVPSPVPIQVQTNVIFVMTNGNNITGLRGRMDRPFASLNYVFTNTISGQQCQDGDTIIIYPGDYDLSEVNCQSGVGLNGWWPKQNRLTILGFGPLTRLFGGQLGVNTPPLTDALKWANPTKLCLGTSNYWAHFWTTNIIVLSQTGNGSNGGTASTNGILDDVTLGAQNDDYVANNSTFGATLQNCHFEGNSDKVADQSTVQSSASDYKTNTFLTIQNCVSLGGGSGDANGFNLKGGGILRHRVINCYSENAGTIQWVNTISNATTTVGGASFDYRPQLIRTNFVPGQVYTNTWYTPIHISGNWTNVQASVAGASIMELWCYAQGSATVTGFTNRYGNQTVVGSTATTNSGQWEGWVPAQYIYILTNQSGGAGNACNPGNGPGGRSGQVYIP